MIIVKASDLKFRYPRDVANRDKPKFTGLPDTAFHPWTWTPGKPPKLDETDS